MIIIPANTHVHALLSVYQRSLIVNLVISDTQKVSCCEENNGKFPILAQTESRARPDRTSFSSQINALSSRKQSRDCLSVSERPDRLSICSQVPALSLRKPSFDTRTMRVLGPQRSFARQLRGIPNSLRRISEYLLANEKKDPLCEEDDDDDEQQPVSKSTRDLVDKMERMALDEICDDNFNGKGESLDSSQVSELSLPPRTPEPEWAYDYGSNPEKTATKRGYYRPKRCWCQRCQIMYRMYKNKEPGLENWGNYPCYQR